MVKITLSPDLVEALSFEAKQSGVELETIVDHWLRQQRAELRRRRLAEQTRLFWESFQELYTQFPGEFVAFLDGQILDHDTDVRQLTLRVRASFPEQPVVIGELTANPVREYRMIGNRLPFKYS